MIAHAIRMTLDLNRRKFLALSGMAGVSFITGQPKIVLGQTGKEDKMAYTAKDYGKLIGMEGFSETLLKNHFTLYQGYVTNTNKLVDILGQMLKEGKTATPEYAELKRRFGWEFNGMRLHEYYFENLGGKGGAPSPGRSQRILEATRPGKRILKRLERCGASAGPSCIRIPLEENYTISGSMSTTSPILQDAIRF
jgi:hypothetical protein